MPIDSPPRLSFVPRTSLPVPNIRPRFSLRTLFVVVTTICVFLGWIGWHLNQVREREMVFQRTLPL